MPRLGTIEVVLSAHIKHLVIAALVAVVVLVGAWKWFAYAGNLAHDRKVLAEATLKEDLDKAKVQAAATKADNTALQGQLNALAASNAALQRDLASLRSQLANQRQADNAMAPDALSLRWSDMIGTPGQVQPNAGGFNVSLAAGHETVSQLEEIPVLRKEKAGIEQDSAKKDAAIAQAQKALGSTADELATCKKTVLDADALCKATMAEVKAKNRKRNIMLSVLAAIGGFLLRSKI
jgi:DNA repair exonuclease SbcCD ATPase subunit